MGQENIKAGLESAVGGMTEFFITIMGQYVCGLAAVACAAALLFTILRAGFGTAQMKEQIETHLMRVALLIICIIVSTGFAVWATIIVGV